MSTYTRAPERPRCTVVIPTFNGAGRIGRCLTALQNQQGGPPDEIIVVNDGSTDATAEIAASFPGVRVITQRNAGPAAARNKGAASTTCPIIVFTDDDCEPLENWLEAMLKPFIDEPDMVGTKGAYKTKQRSLVARFVQLDYEDRYRLLAKERYIDFIDTYSAAFKTEAFLAEGGYDDEFPVACAEDAEFAYRLHRKGAKMVFVPDALVYHQHPDTVWSFLKKKWKFAHWRILAVKKNPDKAIKDSHTPQIMKLQLLVLPALIAAFALDLLDLLPPLSPIVVLLFLLSCVPFVVKSWKSDPVAAAVSPLFLFGRSCAQFIGVVQGFLRFGLGAGDMAVSKRSVKVGEAEPMVMSTKTNAP